MLAKSLDHLPVLVHLDGQRFPRNTSHDPIEVTMGEVSVTPNMLKLDSSSRKQLRGVLHYGCLYVDQRLS